jgi:hypothetical protein
MGNHHVEKPRGVVGSKASLAGHLTQVMEIGVWHEKPAMLITRRCLLLCALTFVFLGGCTVAPTKVVKESYDGYDLEFELRSDHMYLHNTNTTSFVEVNHKRLDAKDAPEFAVFSSDGTEQRVRINNGAITVNGVDYGTIKKGDRIKRTVDGKILVNETERKP